MPRSTKTRSRSGSVAENARTFTKKATATPPSPKNAEHHSDHRSVSMALTNTTTATNTTATATADTSRREGSTQLVAMEEPAITTTLLSPSLSVAVASRKRTRNSTNGKNSVPHSPSPTQSQSEGRSPSAVTRTATEIRARPSEGTRFRLPIAGSAGARLSGSSAELGVQTPRATHRVHEDVEGEELFLDASLPSSEGRTAHPIPSPYRNLQGTPTSQLLSQLQEQPYSVSSQDVALEGPPADGLVTPATVPRRRLPVGSAATKAAATISSVHHGHGEGEYDLRRPSAGPLRRAALPSSPASPSTSASRSSVHDEAVQAILRANPPTTTRPVELKPGYDLPSPRTPLWAALEHTSDNDASSSTSASGRPGRTTRGSLRSEEELQLTNTQVSLFQSEEEDVERSRSTVRGATVAAGQDDHDGGPVPSATREQRRLGARCSGREQYHQYLQQPHHHDSISLPAPGRSLNLLDDQSLREDERLPLFVGTEGEASREGTRVHAVPAQENDESFVFSLTQEAIRQEREHDHQAALPRSRARCTTARTATAPKAPNTTSLTSNPAAAAAVGFTTPSPSRRERRAYRSSPQQASPFSQLQRDVAVHGASLAATARSASPRTGSMTRAAAATAAPATVPPALSQRELRRRADMLKWAERTRAYFYFIDSLPLCVTNSPAKPLVRANTGVEATRSSRSQTIAANLAQGGRTSPTRRGTHLATTAAAPAASVSLVHRSPSATVTSGRGSSAFASAISRVKREVAATTVHAAPRSASTAAGSVSSSR